MQPRWRTARPPPMPPAHHRRREWRAACEAARRSIREGRVECLRRASRRRDAITDAAICVDLDTGMAELAAKSGDQHLDRILIRFRSIAEQLVEKLALAEENRLP